MHTQVKICCISSLDEAALAIRMGADCLGLVGDMPSGPGIISDELIREIATWAPPHIHTFLLTRQLTADAIMGHVRAVGTNTVQVVSHIDPAESARLAALLPDVRIVQVIHVEGPEALELIPVYAPHVQAFLLDSGRPSLAIPELGGTGRVHDWGISSEFVRQSPVPVYLAGGLNPDNVADAIATVHPHGLDLCSGVRTDGKLDADKLARFFASVREGDAR